MTFEDCVKQYPINETLIGQYWYNGEYTADEVKDIPLDYYKYDDENVCFFVMYNGFTNKFESYHFVARPIEGYINTTGKEDDFFPAAHYETGWSVVDFTSPLYRKMEVIFPLDEYTRNKIKYRLTEREQRWEQIAYLWDRQKYEAGYIFTDSDDLKNFVKENF